MATVQTANMTLNTTSSLLTFALNKTLTNSTTNTTTKPAGQNKTSLSAFEIIILCICIPCFIAAVLGNSLVILVRLKALKRVGLSAYKMLICHLSFADIIYSTAIPLDIYGKIHKKSWLQDDWICKTLTTTQAASLTASIGIMTAMALERFQGVSHPLRHHWSRKKVCILVTVIWVYSYANFIPYAIALEAKGGYCQDTYSSAEFAKWYTLYQFISTWLAPLILIISFHFGMVVKVVNHRKNIRKSTYRAKSTNFSSENQARIQNRKMIKILIVISSLFAVLTLPLHIWYLWYEFSHRLATESYDMKVIEVFATLVYLHSAANPIIYSVMDQQFRDDCKAMFFGNPSSQEEIPMRMTNEDNRESTQVQCF